MGISASIWKNPTGPGYTHPTPAIAVCVHVVKRSQSFTLETQILTGPPPGLYHLYLQQLLVVGGVHLLQGLLQLLVPVQEGFPQLRRQVEICKYRAAALTQGAG